jgi:chemotaxis protein MotB
MPRHKKAHAAENHERWLVSYADFITLLFAFFVVMFASSQGDRGRAQQVSDSVKRALEENQVASVIAGILGGTVDDKGRGNAMMRGPGGVKKAQQVKPEKNGRIVELQAAQQFLDRELKGAIDAGKLRVVMTGRGLVVSLQEAAFFPPGDDTISPDAYPSLEKIADALRQLPNPVRLEGHTDSVPINNDRFRSNWELSAGRSIAMLELLSSQLDGRLRLRRYHADRIERYPHWTREKPPRRYCDSQSDRHGRRTPRGQRQTTLAWHPFRNQIVRSIRKRSVRRTAGFGAPWLKKSRQTSRFDSNRPDPARSSLPDCRGLYGSES